MFPSFQVPSKESTRQHRNKPAKKKTLTSHSGTKEDGTRLQAPLLRQVNGVSIIDERVLRKIARLGESLDLGLAVEAVESLHHAALALEATPDNGQEPDGLPDREPFTFCARVQFLDNAHPLVAQREGFLEVWSLYGHDLRVTQRCRRDLDQDLVGARLRDGQLIDHHLVLLWVPLSCTHGVWGGTHFFCSRDW